MGKGELFNGYRTPVSQGMGGREGEREEKLAHMITESEKSHDLPSIRSRPRKVNDLIPVPG